MIASVRGRPELRPSFFPAADNVGDVIARGRKLALQVTQDRDFRLDDGKLVLGPSGPLSTGITSVFLHRAAGVPQALDQVIFGHGCMIARAVEGGDK